MQYLFLNRVTLKNGSDIKIAFLNFVCFISLSLLSKINENFRDNE